MKDNVDYSCLEDHARINHFQNQYEVGGSDLGKESLSGLNVSVFVLLL